MSPRPTGSCCHAPTPATTRLWSLLVLPAVGVSQQLPVGRGLIGGYYPHFAGVLAVAGKDQPLLGAAAIGMQVEALIGLMVDAHRRCAALHEIGRASCRERV